MDERTLNDLLECSVCLERLDTSSKVLPCQHTFCRKCLEVILSSRQELRCPECRILVEIKIDDLPPNVLLMRILEGMKNTAAAAKIQQQHHQQEGHQYHHQQQQPLQESAIIQNDNKIENTLKLNEEQQQQIKLKQQQQQLFYYQQQQNKQKQQVQLQAVHHQQQKQNQHQPQKQLQQNDATNAATNIVNATGSTSTAAAAAAPHQRRIVPHAYALYDFDSNEPSDLHFKKGDVILLKRKVDINWFVGELNGVQGTFPTNYVQVMMPLPSPQCIALYDFKMGPNEEEGCLIFKKGTLIHVLRRVDHNWAEGRIGSMIGIFPIAFVELNPLAKQLLDSFVVVQHSQPPPPIAVQQPQKQLLQQQQHQQNTPSDIPVNQHNNTANNINHIQQQHPRNLPPVPVVTATTNDINTADASKTPDTPTASTSSSSSSQTSPNFHSNTSCSSTSSSLPSSPNQSNPTSPQNSSNVRYRDIKEKRHSLNALLSQASGGATSSSGPLLSIVQSTNRHSAEILSAPSDLSSVQNIRMRSANDISLAGSLKPTTTNTTAYPASSPSPSGEQQQPTMPSVVAAIPRANVLKTAGQQIVPPTLPWGYLALYPYKPRKSDELELKKGCVYVVTERCLDGWFKGKNWQDIAGVFPGNYVTPLRNRDQQQLMHQWKYVQSQPPPIQQQVPQTATQSKHVPVAAAAVATTCIVLHQPPELPPRHSPSSSPVAVASPSSLNCSSSVWSKPLGQTVEAFFSRRSHNTQNDQHDAVVGGGGGGSGKDKDRDKHKDNNAAASTPGCSGSASSAAVSLMKRLTHIKNRSKSPNNSAANAAVAASIQQPITTTAAKATYSMDNPSFEDSSVALRTTAHINQSSHSTNNIHPVHVRSGSCPSQLLQSIPVDLHSSSTNNEASSQSQQPQHAKHQQIPTQDTYSGGSQRIKGCKERSQILTNGRPTAEVAIRGVFNNGTTQQQQQHKKYTKCAQQAQQQPAACSFNNSSGIHHRKSQSLDTNTISAQMAQNNSKNPIETGRGGISTPTANARESRFRCVVSYPPNSEHELDLRVGDVVYVHRKQKNGWYKGTHARTNKTGLFPASFVEPDI